MESVEVTGKSVKEATDNAAKQLGVDASALKVTVLEESKGLFGKSNVRIRAEVAAAPAAAPAKSGRGAKAAPAAEKAPAPEPEPEAEKAPAKSSGRRERKPKAEPKAEEPAEAPAAAAEEQEAPATGDQSAVMASEENEGQMLKIVQDLLDSGNLEVTAKVTGRNGRYINVELDGRDSSFLVGKHGEVLNTMQYLVNIIGNQKYNNGVRATLDCNSYRRKREDALTKLATKIADQVRDRGEEAVLDALPAFERRIVHKSLSDYEGVTTYSEGEEPNRRVVIAPAE